VRLVAEYRPAMSVIFSETNPSRGESAIQKKGENIPNVQTVSVSRDRVCPPFVDCMAHRGPQLNGFQTIIPQKATRTVSTTRRNSAVARSQTM
jgi:hypothetical protein